MMILSVNIRFSELWTYNTNLLRIERNASEKEQNIEYLNETDHTHIHGDLSIIINEKALPRMGYRNDVCFGSWIKDLSRLFKAFDSVENMFTIQGFEQGMPDYIFHKKQDKLYLSICESETGGGKTDPDWQSIEIDYKEFKNEFKKFKSKLLDEIMVKAPHMLEIWSEKFI